MSETINIIQLPDADGFEFVGQPGEPVNDAWWRYAREAILEGLCPRHRKPLVPFGPLPAHVQAAGWHCGGIWSVTEAGAAWDLAYDPHTFEPVVPGWARLVHAPTPGRF